jgi:hypothetical protein
VHSGNGDRGIPICHQKARGSIRICCNLRRSPSRLLLCVPRCQLNDYGKRAIPEYDIRRQHPAPGRQRPQRGPQKVLGREQAVVRLQAIRLFCPIRLDLRGDKAEIRGDASRLSRTRSCLPALKNGTAFSFTGTGSPVRGLRPKGRAAERYRERVQPAGAADRADHQPDAAGGPSRRR